MLAESKSAIDYSKQIESPCGVFGLAVLADRIEFHQWDGQEWLDRSELLGPDGEMIPEWVKSHDFTGDGVVDLFVHYRDPFDGGLLGSMFWQDDCKWSWATFIDDFGGQREMVRDLGWSSSRGDIQGTTLNWDGYTTYFLASFDPTAGVFLIEDVPFSPPPPACVNAFRKIRRLDSTTFKHSWAGTDRIIYGDWWMRPSNSGRSAYPVSESLEKCRPGDWIAEAERNRSTFATHYDAQYYGESYALLLGESAEVVLQQLCSEEVLFNMDRWDRDEGPWESGPIFRTDRAVACD